MSDIISFQAYEEFEQFALIMDLEGETLGQTIRKEILKLKARGMSDENVITFFQNDFLNEGRLFGQIKNAFKSTVNSGIDNIVQAPLYTSRDPAFSWITTSGNPCDDCSPRHGKIKSYPDWVEAGLPRSGFSICRDNCMCVLVPENSVPADFGEPVKIPSLSEYKKQFQEDLKKKSSLKNKIDKIAKIT